MGETYAFAWKDGKFQDLGDKGRDGAVAAAIDSGRIVARGALEGARAVRPTKRTSLSSSRACSRLWHGQLTARLDVNADGVIVGDDCNKRSETSIINAWVRQIDGTVQYLPELSDGHAAALGINAWDHRRVQ